MTSPREPNLSRISAAVRSAAGEDLAVWSMRGREGDLVFHVAGQDAERIGKHWPAIEAALSGVLGGPGGFTPGERHPDGTTSFRVETREAPVPGADQAERPDHRQHTPPPQPAAGGPLNPGLPGTGLPGARQPGTIPSVPGQLATIPDKEQQQ